MEKRSVRVIRVGIMIMAVIAIAVGAADGGYFDVFSKAVMICLECIGIG